ncbi:Rne/Rng family ribonuclease [Fluviibacterium sp. S390]|uniref:Rne/Rng family ribonuclease n=1 Tax=Fluviibacterium sp. S390 TaxID=3415139 RepID=UPI003C7C59ED
MAKKMLIDATHAEETRVVVVDGNKVEEFDFESENKRQIAGNIYLAKVTRVEPSLQAAFVDYGGNRHGFLAFSEIHPDYYQIPVADREALLAEEQAYADQMRDNDAEDGEEEKPSKPRRSRTRSRRKSDKSKDANYDTPVTEAAAAVEPAIPGMDVVDLGEDDQTQDAATLVDDLPAKVDAEADVTVDTAEVAPASEAESTAPEVEPAAAPEVVAAAAPEVVSAPAHEVDAAPETVDVAVQAETPQDEVAPQADTPENSEDAPATETPAPADDAAPEETPDTDGPRSIAASTPSDVVTSADPETLKDTDDDTPAAEVADEPADSLPPLADAAADDDAELPIETPVEEVESKDGDDQIEDVADDDTVEDIRPPRRPRPRRYKIQEVVKVRQIMLVQVVKEERGNKGAALTTYLSLAGRYCVLMPNTARGGGISRKITNVADRKKLKQIAAEIDVPKGAGLIVRTAGAKRTKAEIKRDYEYLQRLWEQIRELTLKSVAPAKIYEEGDLIKRTIRDIYNREIDEVLVEGEGGYRIAKDFMKMIMPSHAKNVKHYNEPMPLFSRFQVETYLSEMFNPTVRLKSGGYIVIGVTEALVAVDVNSGKATKEGSIEETALKTNLEAAEEVARQCRLRDLAGLIVIDFIDMEERKNNAAVEKRLKDKLKTDRARIQVGRISGFGLLEMSRQRLRPGMIEATTQPCAHCHGTGLVRSDDNVSLAILRELEDEGTRNRSREVLVKAPVVIANYLMNAKREHIAHIETRYGMAVRVEADVTLISPDYSVEKFKTATRKVEVAAPVISIDMSNMPEFEEEDDIVEEAEEVTVEATHETQPEGEQERTEAREDGDDKPRKRRRRRRRRRGNGANGENGEATAASSEDAAADAGSEAAAEAPQQDDPEVAAAPVDAAPQDTAEETPLTEPEATPAEETPAVVAEVIEVQTEAEPAPQMDVVSQADPAPQDNPAPQTDAAPAVVPLAEADLAEAVINGATVEPDAPEDSPPSPDTAPEPEAEPTPAPAILAEPVVEETAESAPAEDAPAEPAKPKKRGWWSAGL